MFWKMDSVFILDNLDGTGFLESDGVSCRGQFRNRLQYSTDMLEYTLFWEALTEPEYKICRGDTARRFADMTIAMC